MACWLSQTTLAALVDKLRESFNNENKVNTSKLSLTSINIPLSSS